jgi:DNA invertase Pin-like site-specific DNA recombinase
MGHQIAREYVEHESGGKSADQRPQYARLFADAARREFDMVLVWALDRLSRNGMAATITDLQRLSSYRGTFHSFSEPHLSTENELARGERLDRHSLQHRPEARTRDGVCAAGAAARFIGSP